MLNELRELALSLETAGISLENLHPNFKACPKYPAIQVGIDKDGNVARLTPIPPDQVLKIRKWEKALGTSFPAFNMPPLFRTDSDETREQIKALKKRIEKGDVVSIDEIKNQIDACEPLWEQVVTGKKGAKQPMLEKLADCLSKPISDFAGSFDKAPEACKAIRELIARTRKIDAKQFTGQLTHEFMKKIGELQSPSAIDFLFFYSGGTPSNFQIVLELSDSEYFKFPANHHYVQRWMNSQLLGATVKTGDAGLDAFGCDASGRDSKFPPVGFKNVLGTVILRAMHQSWPCQSRYGMIDFKSFPAGDEVRKSMKSALEWLGSPEQKGKTWSDLSKRMERPMVLFAYPSRLPETVPDLAGMLGDADEGGEDSSETFSTLAQKVTDAFHGKTNETIDCDIRVFVLAKMDKARTKVMASSRYAAAHVVRSAEQWQEVCREIPEIEVRCFGKNRGDKPTWQKPLIPFPAEVVWCLNTVWMAGKDDKGERISRAKSGHGFTINDALCLLLVEGVELKPVASRALGALIRNSSPLLLAIGHSHAVGKVHKTDNKKYSKQLLLLPSIIGLLLHKLGYMKGERMTSPAFLVGRLFNIADSLHLEYCKQVRNNSVPPQLVGNALMATAQEEPVKALSVLWGRIKPYHAWAQTLKDGEHVGLVRYFLKHLGEVSDQLKELELPTRCTDVDKAQMLLGYLAKLESNN